MCVCVFIITKLGLCNSTLVKVTSKCVAYVVDRHDPAAGIHNLGSLLHQEHRSCKK